MPAWEQPTVVQNHSGAGCQRSGAEGTRGSLLGVGMFQFRIEIHQAVASRWALPVLQLGNREQPQEMSLWSHLACPSDGELTT